MNRKRLAVLAIALALTSAPAVASWPRPNDLPNPPPGTNWDQCWEGMTKPWERYVCAAFRNWLSPAWGRRCEIVLKPCEKGGE